MPERVSGEGTGSPGPLVLEVLVRRLQAELDLQRSISSTAVQALVDSENSHAIRVRDLQNELRAYGDALADCESRRLEAERGREVAEFQLNRLRHPSARMLAGAAQRRLTARARRYARLPPQRGVETSRQLIDGGQPQ